MLNLIIYTLTFITGAFLGSFCTLAVYRIPLKQDITHEHSYCPNCKHRLNVLDLMPILSYIFLGGKCRYCNQKVRIRYLLIEILFGIAYMLFIMSLKLDFLSLSINNIAHIVFSTLYLVTLFLIAGIDKEYHEVNKSVFHFGIITSALYIVYLYIVHVNIYRYVIYLAILLLIILIIKLLKKENNYLLQVLTLLIFMLLSTSAKVMISSTILVLVTVLVISLLNRKKEKNVLPIVFYFCVYNICFLIATNFIRI